MNSSKKCRYWPKTSNKYSANIRRSVKIRNDCLVSGEVMSLINPLEHMTIAYINAFGAYANYCVL
jgi:hypothetical protein